MVSLDAILNATDHEIIEDRMNNVIIQRLPDHFAKDPSCVVQQAHARP
jgi:hypothetical protein